MSHENHIYLNVAKTHDVILGHTIDIRAEPWGGSGLYDCEWIVDDQSHLQITSMDRSESRVQIVALKLSSHPIQIKVIVKDLNIPHLTQHQYIFVVIHPVPPIPLTLVSVGQMVLINLNVTDSKYLSFILLSPLPSGLIFKNNLIAGILDANPTYPQSVSIEYLIKTYGGSHETEAQRSTLTLSLYPSLNVMMTLTPNSRLINVGDVVAVVPRVSGGSVFTKITVGI